MQVLRKLDIHPQELTFATLLQRQARRNGDKPYLIFEGRSYSYVEVDRLTNRLANGLLTLGIDKGHHVAIMTGNSARNLLTLFALSKIGAVICPVNTAAKGDLLTYFLTQADCTAVVSDTESLERIGEVLAAAPLLARAIVLGEPDAPPSVPPTGFEQLAVATYETLERASDQPPAVAVNHLDTHGIFYTSGTTGPSKGIVATLAQSLGFSIGRVEYLGLLAEDIVYTCLPLFHGNALHAAALPALLADATLVLSRRFSASAFWREVRDSKATQLNLLSSMTNILWGREPSAEDRQHSLRQCTMVPVPEFAHEFEQRFGVEVVSSYSLTDFGQATFLQPGYPADKYRSAGRARPGVTLTILDDDDQPLPTGATGEICLHTDDSTLGGRYYYKMPEATAAANRSGCFHTGDRGYLDADGYLYFVDRKKDVIRRRGENISSWEVEQVIARHPAVAQVAVFPVDSGMSEDEVMAAVVCREGQTVDPADLVRFCERNMSYFMVPRFIEFMPDLPRTLTEKVQKHVLRELAESRLQTLWDREKAGIELTR